MNKNDAIIILSALCTLLLFLLCMAIYAFIEAVNDIDTVISAEEYLRHPDYYKVDTVQVNDCTFYYVKEK